MAKTIENASKTPFASHGAERGGSIYRMDPDAVVIIGRDRDVTEATEFLAQNRSKNEFDEDMVLFMMEEGVHTPIKVVKDGEDALVVDGRQRVINLREANRRLREAKAEPLMIPFTIIKVDEARALALGVVLNEHRIDTNAMDKAIEASRMIERGTSEKKVCTYYRIHPVTLKGWLSLLDCDKRVQKAVRDEAISPSAAAKLASLPREEQVKALDELIASGGAGVAAVEREVQARKSGKKQGVERDEERSYPLPSRGQLKKLLKLVDENCAEDLDPAFVDAVRWIAGDKNPKTIRGLTAALGAVKPRGKSSKSN